jgi:acetyltransferase-like isoleucine patch superfamily enzyme
LKLIIVNDVKADSLLSNVEDEVISRVSTKIMGQHIVARNIATLKANYKIRSIEIPHDLYPLKNIILEQFPSIDVLVTRTRSTLQRSSLNENSSSQPTTSNSKSVTTIEEIDSPSTTTIRIPFSSILYTNEQGNTVIDDIRYPWDFLKSVQTILRIEVTSTRISPKAKISKTSVIDGPCIIEEGVMLDDFCKIKGPAYIGKNSFIGMGSLIRNCILEHNTRIGFNCEIGKSYFAGNDRISHHNVILDTIIGQNVWFGGYSGTANVLLDRRNVKYKMDNDLIDTGTDHFGSVIGNNCSIGASVIILPGRKVLPNTQIQAGSIIKN